MLSLDKTIRGYKIKNKRKQWWWVFVRGIRRENGTSTPTPLLPIDSRRWSIPPRSISAVRKTHQRVAVRRRANLRDKPLPGLQETQPYPSHASLRASSNRRGLRLGGRSNDQPAGFTSGGNVDDKERLCLWLWFMIYEIHVIYFERRAQEVIFHILSGLLLLVVQVNQFISSEQRLSAWGEKTDSSSSTSASALHLDWAFNPTPAFISSHPLFLLYPPPTITHPLSLCGF